MNPIPAGLTANAPDVEIDIEQSRLFNADLAPVPQSRPQVGHVELRRAVDFDVRLHPDLHARVGTHRRRNELVAGHLHDFSRQPHRAHPDDPQRARRNALRNSVSGLLPRVIRHERRERAGNSPRARRVRLVWNSNVDRRRGDLQNLRDDFQSASRSGDELARHHGRTIPLLPVFLGRQHVRDLSRHRNDPLAAEHQSAAAPRARIVAAVVGVARGGRLRADPVATVSVRRGPTARPDNSGLTFFPR